MLVKKRLAVTDIDGTLAKGFFSVDFIHYLNKQGLFHKSAYLDCQTTLQSYKRGEIKFVDLLDKFSTIWSQGIQGASQKEILVASNKFFPSYLPSIYPSSKELVSFLKLKNYYVVGITVGAIEPAILIKNELGLDEIYASKVNVVDGKYTGPMITSLHTPNGKEQVLKKIVSADNIDLSKSISFGDSIHDLPLFEMTEIKVALNPDFELMGAGEKAGCVFANSNNVLSVVRAILWNYFV